MIFKKKDSAKENLFMTVERRLTGQGYDVYYPTIHKKEALEYIKHLRFYLTKEYGWKMKGQFLARVQKTINSTKSDYTTGK